MIRMFNSSCDPAEVEELGRRRCRRRRGLFSPTDDKGRRILVQASKLRLSRSVLKPIRVESVGIAAINANAWIDRPAGLIS